MEKVLEQAVADVLEKGVTEEELNKAKTLDRVGEIHERETATSLASALGIGGAVCQRPRPRQPRPGQAGGGDGRGRAGGGAEVPDAGEVDGAAGQPRPAGPQRPGRRVAGGGSRHAGVDGSRRSPRPPGRWSRGRCSSPPAIPPHPPAPEAASSIPRFEKGTESLIDGVRVIVMPDHRLPLVSWNLTVRRGSHLDPAGKEGLAALTDADAPPRLRRHDLSARLNEDLESRGISLEVSDGGDVTRVVGVLDHRAARPRPCCARSRCCSRLPSQPTSSTRLKEQMVNDLALSQENPSTVAEHEMNAALYGASPLGVTPTPQSVSAVTLDDVKKFYASQYRASGAILVLSGDLTVERGEELAQRTAGGVAAGQRLRGPAGLEHRLPFPRDSREAADHPGGPSGRQGRYGPAGHPRVRHPHRREIRRAPWPARSSRRASNRG